MSKEKLKELVHEKLKVIGSNSSTLNNAYLLFEALWNKTIPAPSDYKLSPGLQLEPLKLHEALDKAREQLEAEMMIGVDVKAKYGTTPQELRNDGVRILDALKQSKLMGERIKEIMGLVTPSVPKEVPKNERN